MLTSVLPSAAVITINKRGTTLLALQIVKKVSTSFGKPEGFITVPKGLSVVQTEQLDTLRPYYFQNTENQNTRSNNNNNNMIIKIWVEIG